MTLKQLLEPARASAEAKLAPITKRVTAYWTQTKWFTALAQRIFDRADIDKNGTLNQAELYLCMLRVYEEINVRLPTHVKAPSKQDMLKLLKKVDADSDGELSFPEFLNAARLMFGASSTDFSLPVHVVVILLLRLALLPLLSNAILMGAGAVGGPFKPLLWVPGISVILPVLLEILLRSAWHEVMDDDE